MTYGETDNDIILLANRARQLLAEYYGSAMCGDFPAAEGDLISVQSMSDSQAIREAQRLGLI